MLSAKLANSPLSRAPITTQLTSVYTLTNTDTCPSFSVVLRKKERINPNCGMWESGEKPGLLGASS